MDDRVIFTIQEYMYDFFEPKRNWPAYEFRKRSYERWATTELLNQVRAHPERDSVEVVREFAQKMDKYAGIDHDDRNDSFIFFVARDVATDILDVLKAMN